MKSILMIRMVCLLAGLGMFVPVAGWAEESGERERDSGRGDARAQQREMLENLLDLSPERLARTRELIERLEAMGEDQRRELRKRVKDFHDQTPEEIERQRERWREMSPEERREHRRQTRETWRELWSVDEDRIDRRLEERFREYFKELPREDRRRLMRTLREAPADDADRD